VIQHPHGRTALRGNHGVHAVSDCQWFSAEYFRGLYAAPRPH
jgi:hypothetical protein